MIWWWVDSDSREGVLRLLGLNDSIIIGIVNELVFYFQGRALGQKMVISVEIFILLVILLLQRGDLPLKIILVVILFTLTGLEVIV